MYIYSVNGKVVLEKHHKEIAKEIMKGVVVDLVVLQHFRSSNWYVKRENLEFVVFFLFLPIFAANFAFLEGALSFEFFCLSSLFFRKVK